MATQPCQSACSEWVEVEDFDGTQWGDELLPDHQTILEQCIVSATDALFEWSGRKWAGVCMETVTIGDRDSTNPSNVCRLRRVKLGGYPVTSITSVDIAGDAIAEGVAGGYQVDDWRWLTRIDNANGSNDGWPIDGTLVVTYVYGAMPPPLGRQACIELAGELALAHTAPDKCKKPERVTSVQRQGVNISYAEPGAFKDLPLVKTFLEAYNPTGRKRRAGVLNPDLLQEVHRTNTG